VPSQALLGEAACLGAASVWALTLAMFRRPIAEHGARAVNLGKCTLAAVLLGATTWIVGQGGQLRAAGARELLLVAASGLVGLTIGDTALFTACAKLGAYRAVLLQTLAPVFTAVLAYAAWGETLGGGRLPGMLLTMAGIGLVISHSAPRRHGPLEGVIGSDGAIAAPPAGTTVLARVTGTGVALGILSALCQGTGIVMAKAGMTQMTFLPASFLRLGAAAAGLIVLEAVMGRLGSSVRDTTSRRTLLRLAPAAFMGSYVGIMLMMAGIERAPAAVATVLISTTPVFSLFLDVARGRERLTLRGIAGTLLAVAGVGLISR